MWFHYVSAEQPVLCSYMDFVITLADFEKGVFYFKFLFILFVQENINSGADFLEAASQ